MYEKTFYAVYDDGSTGMLTVQAQDAVSVTEPVLSKPGRLTDVADYDEARTRLQELRDGHVGQLLAADRQRTQEDYAALVAAGIPEATARRLSGWAG